MITRLPLPFPPPRVGSLRTLPGRLLPGRLHSQGLTLLLNRLLSEALAGGELDFLQDRVLQIEVMDLALDYRLTLDRGKLAAAAPGSAPDVRFGGRSREFLLLALNECRVPCDYIPKRSYPLFRTRQILNDWLTQNL
ncbi:ubiquinone anaerobic biosynthesis accessory factor UbiT, partial [Thiolapillus sp.]